MHVLVSRGGELVAPFGPVWDLASLAVLDSGCPADTATVADRDDITTEHLAAAAAAFLARTGWAESAGPKLAAELARNMADHALEVAGWFAVGTQLEASFDHDTDEWDFRVIHPV